MSTIQTEYLAGFAKLNDCAFFRDPSESTSLPCEAMPAVAAPAAAAANPTETTTLVEKCSSASSSEVVSSFLPKLSKLTPTTVTNPDLVLLLGWAGAPLQYVAKYTSAYVELFPSTPLLLVLTPFSHLMLHTKTSQDAGLAPVLKIIRQFVDPGSPSSSSAASGRAAALESDMNEERDEAVEKKTPRFLVHTFSNGGSYKLVEIALRYQRATSTALPVTTLFLDSAPGLPAIRKTVAALTYGMPKAWIIRLIGRTCLWIGLLVLRLWHKVTRREHLMIAMRRRLIDASLISSHARRCYLYSDSDELVGVRDVQDHAGKTAAKGIAVRGELFKGSQHVAHARAEPERYWSIILEEWEASMRSEENNKKTLRLSRPAF